MKRNYDNAEQVVRELVLRALKAVGPENAPRFAEKTGLASWGFAFDPARLDYQDGLIELLTSNGLGATGRGELDLAKQRFDDALALVPGLPKKGAKTMEWIATAHYGLAAVVSERKQHEDWSLEQRRRRHGQAFVLGQQQSDKRRGEESTPAFAPSLERRHEHHPHQRNGAVNEQIEVPCSSESILRVNRGGGRLHPQIENARKPVDRAVLEVPIELARRQEVLGIDEDDEDIVVVHAPGPGETEKRERNDRKREQRPRQKRSPEHASL